MIPAPFLDAHMQLDKRKTLNAMVLAMTGLTICFFVFACVVSSNANAGFNVVFTAVIYAAYAGLLAIVFNKKRPVDQGLDLSIAIEPMAGGVLIGMTTMMCFLSLMTAVYWGEMSGCEDDTDDVEGYSCYSAWAMVAVAWFASFLLVTEGLTLAALILWKEDIFFVDGGYDNFDAQEDRGAYNSSAYAYDGATFGTGGVGGGGAGGGEARGSPQEADL